LFHPSSFHVILTGKVFIFNVANACTISHHCLLGLERRSKSKHSLKVTMFDNFFMI
uniref:Ovule protein n=1 Tax=Brugia timori TaxID=42155 RepID=A0A0R3Q797_9BILA